MNAKERTTKEFAKTAILSVVFDTVLTTNMQEITDLINHVTGRNNNIVGGKKLDVAVQRLRDQFPSLSLPPKEQIFAGSPVIVQLQQEKLAVLEGEDMGGTEISHMKRTLGLNS